MTDPLEGVIIKEATLSEKDRAALPAHLKVWNVQVRFDDGEQERNGVMEPVSRVYGFAIIADSAETARQVLSGHLYKAHLTLEKHKTAENGLV